MPTLRICRDAFYAVTTLVAAICFVSVALLVLYQLGGQLFPYVPRSADEFAGYCMGASAFLGLADALRSGDHVRVTLVTDRVAPGAKRMISRVSLLIGCILALWMTWHLLRMAWHSWETNELSSGLVALPMWLPQFAMAWGAAAFALRLLELIPQIAAGADLPGQGAAEDFNADR